MKKKITGLLGLACAAMLSVSLAACGGEETPPSEGGGNNPPVVQSKDPAVVGESRGYYFEELPGDMTFNMRLNGGGFQSVKADGKELTRNNEYRFNIGTEVLTLNNSWLATLSEGDHTVTFTTNLGSCNITVTIGEKGLADGYNMQIAKFENDLNDNFYVKAGRTDGAVKFDFLTFGDFGKEGAGLEFINVLIDNSPFDDTGLNWRLGAEDVNVRVYSDGSVVYRTFTGTEEKNGVQNGLDNIWWRINRTKPNYKTEGVDDVTISRENGVTKFTLELSYEFLKIDAAADIRFALMECSDTSQNDFNLYDNGIVVLDGNPLNDPVKLADWPMLDADGNVVRPENIVIKGVPEGYDLSFATMGDRFYGKISLADTGVKFDFWTQGNFGINANGGMEFVNIYLDMPNAGKWNKTGLNWAFEDEDINIRVYSDGTVYKKTNFNGNADNVWYARNDGLTDDNKLVVTAETSKSGGATFVSVTVPYAEFNNATKDAFAGFRFYLAEGADKPDNFMFEYFGADLAYRDKRFGADNNLANWPLFDKSGNIVRPEDIVEEPVKVEAPAGYDLSFAKNGDEFYGKFSLADAGVTFDFWTAGNFSASEFINIYLDMPNAGKWNKTGLNWAFEAEDINLRVYGDGTVYKKTGFNGNADNVWYSRFDGLTDANKLAGKATITKENGACFISVTVPYAEFNNATKDTFAGFRFYLAEGSDKPVGEPMFNYVGADLAYQNKKIGDDYSVASWALFDKRGNIVRAEDIVEAGIPADAELTFAMQRDGMYGKIYLAEGDAGVMFEFYTNGTFTGNEFVNIYLDMPTPDFSTNTTNWAFETGDINLRVYADGTVYKKADFTGTADCAWYPRNVLTADNVLAQRAVITTDDAGTTRISVSLTFEQLNTTKSDFKGFRFYLSECEDADGGYAYSGADLAYKGFKAGVDCKLPNWLPFTVEGKIDLGLPQDYELTFAQEWGRTHGKISFAEGDAGITFGFATQGDFAGNAAKFINIYLDMPEWNTSGKNWALGSEDINIRVYGDGKVYLRKGFSGEADCVWYNRDALIANGTQLSNATVGKDAKTGVTSIRLTVSFEELLGADKTKADFNGFRFWLAKCNDNAGAFDYCGNDLSYRGVSAGADAVLATWSLFNKQGNIVLAADITE